MENTSPAKSLNVPASMQARVRGDPDELKLVEKRVPHPGAAEVLLRIDAVAPAFLSARDFGRSGAKENTGLALVIQAPGLKKSPH